MYKLSHVLQSHQPEDIGSDSLKAIVANYSSLVLEDAWGNPFVVSRSPGEMESEGAIYTVRSVGMAGKLVDCCQRWVEDFREDALIENSKWKQCWQY